VRHSDRVPIDTPSSWSRAERQEPPRPRQGTKAQAYRHEGLAVAGETTWKALIEWGTPTGSTGSSAGHCPAWSASSVSAAPGEDRRAEHPRPGSRGAVVPAVLRRGARSCGRQRAARRGDLRRRLGVAGRPRLLDAVLDDDGGVGAQAGRVSSVPGKRPGRPGRRPCGVRKGHSCGSPVLMQRPPSRSRRHTTPCSLSPMTVCLAGRSGASTADGAASATCRRPGAPGARPTRRSTPGASRQCPCGAATRER